ncbi:MAG: hypothetical protein K2P70_17270 [Hyphomonadaceae bacterium]|jgi:hypothetical protein|nr:hypothetical protein [Hyphomonadaceae bacterium]
MTAGVISHRGAPRKRAPSRGWTARRLLAVALTLIALAAIIWVAPYLRPAAPTGADPILPPQPVTVAPELPLPTAAEAPAAAARRARAPQRASGIPLDGRPANPGEDFEVLTASELDAISQASPRGE